jgi:hypothetical protein
MGWVQDALAELKKGRTAQVRPQGGSMRGRIESGQLVTIEPSNGDDVEVDDVVMIRWKRNYILHIVKKIRNNRLLIGNNLGKLNGWGERRDVVGRVTDVAD